MYVDSITHHANRAIAILFKNINHAFGESVKEQTRSLLFVLTRKIKRKITSWLIVNRSKKGVL